MPNLLFLKPSIRVAQGNATYNVSVFSLGFEIILSYAACSVFAGNCQEPSKTTKFLSAKNRFLKLYRLA